VNDHQCPYGEHGKLCERMDNIKRRLEEKVVEHGDLWNEVKSKAPLALMLWLLGGIFIALMTIAGWGGHLSGSINDNKSCLAVMQKDLEHISAMVNKIDRRVSRLPVPPRDHGNNGEQ
jgi:hypothetical protein